MFYVQLNKISKKHLIIIVLQGTVVGNSPSAAEAALGSFLDSFKTNHGSLGGQEFMTDYLNSEGATQADYLDAFLGNLNREKKINGLLKTSSRLKSLREQ